MKTLIASIILFLILVGIIIGNLFYIRYATDRLWEYTESISVDSPDEDMERLSAFWKRHKKFIALSASYTELDDICELIIKLSHAHKTGNTAAIEKNKELVLDELIGITRFEKISIENIF